MFKGVAIRDRKFQKLSNVLQRKSQLLRTANETQSLKIFVVIRTHAAIGLFLVALVGRCADNIGSSRRLRRRFSQVRQSAFFGRVLQYLILHKSSYFKIRPT